MPLRDLGRYVNPFTDFGFKKLFGTEANKDLLIDFLNALLGGTHVIADLEYKSTEKLGEKEEHRKTVFDLYCIGTDGSRFIIELQNAKQRYYKDRSLYYATYPIRDQGIKGIWNYQLQPVYVICILNFVFEEPASEPDEYLRYAQVMDTRRLEVLYDKLTFVYIEMPKFTKEEHELKTNFDKWLFVLKNLAKFQQRPEVLKEYVFRKLFKLTEVANLNEEELKEYEAGLKAERDWHNVLDYAKEEGRVKTILEAAKNLKDAGFSLEQVVQFLNATDEEREMLKKEIF